MENKSDHSSEALGRIAPRRKNLKEPINPYASKKPPISEGITIPTPVKRTPASPRFQRQVYRSFPEVAKEEKTQPVIKEKPPEEVKEEPKEVRSETNETDELEVIIKDVKSSKPKKYRKLFYIILALITLGCIGLTVNFLFFNSKPGLYSELSTESFDQNSMSYSFKYPSILTETSKLSATNPNVQVAFVNSTGSDNTLEDLSTLSDAQVINTLKLTPSDILNQIKAGKGNYIDYLNKGYPGNYKKLFGNCVKNMVNVNNQTFVVCTNNSNGYVDTRLVGADRNYQYILQLYMSESVWDKNQNVWQQVEKSFSW